MTDEATTTEDKTDGSQQGAAGGESVQKIERPPEIGTQFDGYWADDKGLDYQKLGTDFDALRALKAETDSRLARVPEKPEDYEAGLPEGFKLPEGMKFEIDADDPMLGPAREFAKAHGLSKEDFKGLVALKAQMDLAEHETLVKAAAAEMEKLGSKGTQRVEAITTFLQARIGDDLAAALAPTIFSAKQVEAFEKLMDLAKGGAAKFNAGGRETEQPGTITEEEYAALSPRERIERARELSAQRKTNGAGTHA